MIGGLGASEPRDQEQSELLTHQTSLSPTGSELREGKNKRQRHLEGCTWGRLLTTTAPTGQGAMAAKASSCRGKVQEGS